MSKEQLNKANAFLSNFMGQTLAPVIGDTVTSEPEAELTVTRKPAAGAKYASLNLTK